MKSRFRAGAKVCSGAIMILLVIAALGPAKWAPRTELGWQFDHFIGYFGITLFVCLAWPRPFVVGGVIMTVAMLLESLQALTPDRSANLEAALWGAAGGLAAALVAELFIQAWKWCLKSARAVGPVTKAVMSSTDQGGGKRRMSENARLLRQANQNIATTVKTRT